MRRSILHTIYFKILHIFTLRKEQLNRQKI